MVTVADHAVRPPEKLSVPGQFVSPGAYLDDLTPRCRLGLRILSSDILLHYALVIVISCTHIQLTRKFLLPCLRSLCSRHGDGVGYRNREIFWLGIEETDCLDYHMQAGLLLQVETVGRPGPRGGFI